MSSHPMLAALLRHFWQQRDPSPFIRSHETLAEVVSPTAGTSHVAASSTAARGTGAWLSSLSALAWLDEIHYSWESKTRFPEEQISTFSKAFVAQLKKQQLAPATLKLRLYLPLSALNPLLELSKDKLVYLIECLGWADLAFEMRAHVDKKIIAKITSILTQEEMALVNHWSRQSSKWTPERLDLLNWDGSRQELLKQLHSRGLFRMAAAIADEDRDFCWYLIHRLDKGRGTIIEREMKRAPKPLIPYFKGQLLELLRGI